MASFVQKGFATLIITNFREYIECLRNLFAGEQAGALSDYAQDVAQSGRKQKEVKEKLQKEIVAITAKINFWRQRIKEEEDKVALSQEITKFKEVKQDLLRKLKQKSQTSRFAMLSDESKATLCCLTVLRKYLTKELMNNKFVGMATDDDGNLIFSQEVFENSFLYNDARHIYDYMLAYIIEHPEQVLSETHFNKFFDKESGWRGIVHFADKYFEEKNKRKKKSRAEIIAESRSDLELIKEYPQQKVVLVRLITPEALDYEGAAAHNCVGAGSYDKLLNQVNSGIFSLRRETKDGELKPVATVELKNGLITQFRGICNGIVAYDYNLAARDVSLRMMRAESIAELVNNEKLSDSVLNSLGIYRDKKGGFLDIHNLSGDEGFVLPKLVVDGDSLGKYEFEKLKIEQLQIEGLRPKDAKYLSKFKRVKNLTINQIEDGVVLDLSGFDYLTDLTTELKNGLGKIVNLPKSVTRITYRGKNVLHASGEVERIYIQCSGNNKVSLEDIPSAKDIVVNSMGNIDLSGDTIYPRLESLSSDGDLLNEVCAEKFPNLTMLSCSNIKSLGHIPSLKMIDLTGTSDTLIDLSNNPQLLVAKIKGKGVKLRLADCYPNLKDFYTENVGLDLFDVKSFPQLENLKLGVSDSCIIRFRPDSKLKSVSMVSSNNNAIFTLEGQTNGRETLYIDNVNAPVFLNDNIGFGKVEFRNSYLNDPLPDCFNDMETFFDNTRLSAELCRRIAVINVDSRNRDNGAAPVIDFSDCQSVDFSSFAVLPAERLILPERMEKLVLHGTLFPAAEIVGGRQIRNLDLAQVYKHPFIDKLDYGYIEELTLHNVTQNDFIAKCPNLKKLNCTMLPLERVPEGITDLTYHSAMGIAMEGDEPQRLFDEIVDFSSLGNVKKLDLRMNLSHFKSLKLPQNIESLAFMNQMCSMQVLDLSPYPNLKKISLRNSFSDKFEKVILPESVEELDAGRGDMDAIGYCKFAQSDGPEKPAKVFFEIPQTAKPEVIAYLQKEWGKDNVIIVPPKNKKEQNLLSVVMMKQKLSRGNS